MGIPHEGHKSEQYALLMLELVLYHRQIDEKEG